MFIDSWVYPLHQQQSQRIRYSSRLQQHRLLLYEKPCTVQCSYILYHNKSICLAWFTVSWELFGITKNKIGFFCIFETKVILDLCFIQASHLCIWLVAVSGREKHTNIYHTNSFLCIINQKIWWAWKICTHFFLCETMCQRAIWTPSKICWW